MTIRIDLSRASVPELDTIISKCNIALAYGIRHMAQAELSRLDEKRSQPFAAGLKAVSDMRGDVA